VCPLSLDLFQVWY